ncbi:AAA family ATPase [Azotobacter chroococcum subsp. isscasi]|uniref:ATP-dependent nuclease n=1 Tax=Azotobacter chroococcum TaxID=353 RepID=UPI00103FA822|nr:AAA family ATPase [Azotobacter chroococcum]TBW12407.1 AAA family ATPase [Azotobacter chroococcum subsp. isscasi]
MSFPFVLNTTVQSHNGNFNREITIRNGLTVLIGPNGSGKTHLLRAIKNALPQYVQGKKIRFISAGRMGLLEQNRSDYDGHRGSNILYEHANFGSKSDIARRHNIETLNGDFQTLSERADILVKVQERLRKLFKRDLIIEWDAGTLKVVFARLDKEGSPYSSGREASGLLHLVGLLAALYDDDVGALMLDEPEVSLHPQLQAFLLNEITSAAGHYSESGFKKIIIMATHSTEMLNILKCEDLLSLVFCHDLDTAPVQIPPESGVLQNKKVQALVARLGQEHKLSLFCKKPLLVEGPSDALISSFLSQKLELHLEASGSQILPVIGTGQMPVVSKFMKLLGKTPVVLADADAFADGLELTNYYLDGSIAADQKAAASGAASAISLANSAYNDFCKLVNDKWQDIAPLAIAHPYWVNKEEGEDVKAKRRAALCTLFSHDESALSDITPNRAWVVMKSRLEAVLDLLELAGCFILRKGAIESYYQSSDTFTSEGKPSAAVDEIEHLDGLAPSQLEALLPEMARCIKFASQGEKINEAESLRDVLLSIAAPAMAKLNAGSNTQEMKVLCKTILREKSELFELTIENDQLIIKLNSNILNVSGFPIALKKDEDVIKKIECSLRSNA